MGVEPASRYVNRKIAREKTILLVIAMMTKSWAAKFGCFLRTAIHRECLHSQGDEGPVVCDVRKEALDSSSKQKCFFCRVHERP